MMRPMAALIHLLLVSGSVQATVINVPADQPTIQAGIDVAITGDTVLVADGIYTGEGNRDISFSGRDIVLRSVNGPQVTIIDSQGSESSPHRGFVIRSGSSITVVDGFTIRGGYAYDGGGIRCYDSSPTIMNNIISGNRANTFGGGIYCDFFSEPTIINNSISGNSAGSGGGISCIRYSVPAIISNDISGNSATGGGGISYYNSLPTISNNIISGNSASYSGGGIFCYYSRGTISNNTFGCNSALYGGGIYCDYSNPVVANTILAFSRSGSGIACNGDRSPTLVCCDVYGNMGGDWVDCIADQFGHSGNFSADPLFCDTAAGDFYLSSYSSCTARNNSCSELIGALGVACGQLLCGDADGDGRIALADIEFLKNYYFTRGRVPYPLWSSDANCDGEVNIGDIISVADYLFRDNVTQCCP